MRKVWGTLWMLIAILLMLCVTSTAFAQQKRTEAKDLQYIETVDLRELVNTMKDLTRNVSALSDNQKELTDNIKDLTNSVNNINTKIAKIEERTTWITAILLIILAAIFGGVVTYFFSNRGKKEKNIPKVNALDEVKKENQDETPYDISTEDDLQIEGGIP